MFESFVSSLKSHSYRLTESISIDNFKLKASETLDNLRSNIADKTGNISVYFNDIQSKNGPSRTVSTPNFKKISNENRKPTLKWPVLINNQMVWVDYDTYQNELEEDLEPDIVDRFVRVITIDEENNVKCNRRNDREEIRRRLATGDNDDYYGGEKAGKKPSLQARLQSGMNLQICFMNETSSDTESPSSESPLEPQSLPPVKTNYKPPPEPPKSLILPSSGRTRNINSTPGPQSLKVGGLSQPEGGDFFSRQARLQTEARLALAQAKDRARLQMEAERHRAQTSPITQMLRDSLNKVGIKFPEDRRRLSRQMLTDMNVAQLQVIVNDLHTQIEILNESLVKLLMERDELHMSQDSMLVDIEDITRYLGAKESCLKEDIVKNNNISQAEQVQPPQPQSRPVITRIVSLGKK